MKTAGQSILKQLSGQAFLVKAPVTLTFDPVTSKSIGSPNGHDQPQCQI
jgi:hypothetical protein